MARPRQLIQFAHGVFLRNDDFGAPLFVGDRVAITRKEQLIKEEVYPDWDNKRFITNHIRIDAKTDVGTLVLWKSKELMLKHDRTGSYMKIQLGTRHPYVKREWRKLYGTENLEDAEDGHRDSDRSPITEDGGDNVA